MLSWFMRFSLIALVCLAFISCARKQRVTPTPGPTETAVVYPPTFTPVVPPTKTPPPPTRAPEGATLEVLKGANRTNLLNVYSAHMEMILSSPTRSLMGEPPNTSIRYLTLDGNIDRANSRWQLSGALVGLSSGDPSSPIELRTLGNRGYILGPLPALGANEKRWYSLNVVAEDEIFDTASGKNSIGIFDDAKVTLPTFHSDGAEVLDKRACIIYRADPDELGDYYSRIDANNRFTYDIITLPKTAFSNNRLAVWVCDDGYVHKMSFAFDVQCGCQNKDRVHFEMETRIWDMNIIIPIESPNGAVPLPNPFMFPTPQPDVQTS